MASDSYLTKHLIDFERTLDGKYCTGKFTGCMRTFLEDFFAVSDVSFVRISSHAKGCSKRFKTGNATKSSIYFNQTNSLTPIPYNGFPFEIIATEKWVCNQVSSVKKPSVDKIESRKRKARNNADCEAYIQVRTVRVYTQFSVEKSNDMTADEFKNAKDHAKNNLIKLINSGQKTNYTVIHYCRFPLSSAHNHDHNNSRVTSTQLDKRVTSKIRELAKSGIYDPHSIKSMIEDFVTNTLFAHAEENEKPKPDNKRYHPSIKAIRNHVFLAVGGIRNLPGYSLRGRNTNDDSQPPSVTNVLEIPTECNTSNDKLEGKSIQVGLVAIHAGAGFHSDQRWPGYKHLCENVCSEVNKQLKIGMSAGEAATLAVKMLEDSDFTNAGVGSNLTENGNVECDASVMDTTTPADLSNQCDSYFGSLACVSKIKNPVCAAYKILDERRKRPILELGRIPPSFLVSEGAENWSRAHGIQMCDPNELISESAYKSWQKYHRKLVAKIAGNRLDYETENGDMLNNRYDTVGSVVLDLQGNVASAVSSGGLLLKMPGRVGQAASYGCGCWASPGEADKAAVAVTTSGCGEQLVSTTIAKTCAENLKEGDQPYQVLHDTLVNDFLGSPMLSSDSDKQAGLLCLHRSEDLNNCTVEVVWGHTTSSMVIGHMSTNDTVPKVICSRLPDNAVPGKSVTVGGSWTKVGCPGEGAESDSTNSVETEMECNNHTIEESTKLQMPACTVNENADIVKSFDGLSDGNSEKEEIDSEMTIMFASPLAEGISENMCNAVLSDEYNRKVDPEFEKSIDSNWEARVQKNSRLFNAQKFRIHSVRFENVEDSPKFTFNLGLTCYKDYMETNWSENVDELLKRGTLEHGNSQAYLSEPLGVAAIVLTNDGKVIFQWRNSWLAESAGMLDVPGGHPEPIDAAGFSGETKKFVTFDDLKPENVVSEIFSSQMKEVRDEVNVPLEKIGKPMFTGLMRNNLSAGRPVAYFYMSCDMSSDEILHQYSKGGAETDESTKLQFIPEKDIKNLKRDQPDLWEKMCPNSKSACIFYSMVKRKQAEQKEAS